MRIYDAAIKAVSGDEAALDFLREHALRPDGRCTIIACDFDGTLCESHYPEIVAPNAPVVESVKLLMKLGYEIILWTCREEDDLEDALWWLETQGITGLKVNDNAESIKALFGGYNSRKISADEYWDDKAISVSLF